MTRQSEPSEGLPEQIDKATSYREAACSLTLH
jgi:hypothetical protein